MPWVAWRRAAREKRRTMEDKDKAPPFSSNGHILMSRFLSLRFPFRTKPFTISFAQRALYCSARQRRPDTQLAQHWGEESIDALLTRGWVKFDRLMALVQHQKAYIARDPEKILAPVYFSHVSTVGHDAGQQKWPHEPWPTAQNNRWLHISPYASPHDQTKPNWTAQRVYCSNVSWFIEEKVLMRKIQFVEAAHRGKWKESTHYIKVALVDTSGSVFLLLLLDLFVKLPLQLLITTLLKPFSASLIYASSAHSKGNHHVGSWCPLW